ncbi:MAG: nitroreductase [Acidobacteriia bacterium]|jgi:nitroreductase|nr:nitroreductase [Terriglobia bacterium]
MPDTQPLHELLAQRWSPRDYDPRAIDPAVLRSLFEAARSSFSCFNEQPWRFVVATKAEPEDYALILDTLVPFNQNWAKNAWLVGLSFGKKTFAKNGNPNRYNLHDTGAALADLAVQATAHGLYVHGMGGYDAEKARTTLGIPEDYEVGCAFTIGYLADGIEMPPRQRNPLTDQFLRPGWTTSPLVSD